MGNDMIPEGVGENQDHGDHETVYGERLDYRQPDEQRPRDRSRCIWLLRQRSKCRRHRFSLPQRRSDYANGNGQASRQDGYGRNQCQSM